MNDSDRLQMNINSIIGLISTVIGIVGLIVAGVAFSFIAMIIFGCLAIISLWFSRKARPLLPLHHRACRLARFSGGTRLL